MSSTDQCCSDGNDSHSLGSVECSATHQLPNSIRGQRYPRIARHQWPGRRSNNDSPPPVSSRAAERCSGGSACGRFSPLGPASGSRVARVSLCWLSWRRIQGQWIFGRTFVRSRKRLCGSVRWVRMIWWVVWRVGWVRWLSKMIGMIRVSVMSRVIGTSGRGRLEWSIRRIDWWEAKTDGKRRETRWWSSVNLVKLMGRRAKKNQLAICPAYTRWFPIRSIADHRLD